MILENIEGHYSETQFINPFVLFHQSAMTIHPEEGIHWPTMITAVVAITAISIYQQLIMPNMPFLIRSYFPDVTLLSTGQD